jgi:hypothetical protein
MNENAQLRTAQAKGRPARSDPSDIAPKLERKWFEFDRSVVLRQIDLMRDTIDANANDLGMVAVEGVFEKSLSEGLLRGSRALHVVAQELRALHGLVARTKSYSKAFKKRD